MKHVEKFSKRYRNLGTILIGARGASHPISAATSDSSFLMTTSFRVSHSTQGSSSVQNLKPATTTTISFSRQSASSSEKKFPFPDFSSSGMSMVLLSPEKSMINMSSISIP